MSFLTGNERRLASGLMYCVIDAMSNIRSDHSAQDVLNISLRASTHELQPALPLRRALSD